MANETKKVEVEYSIVGPISGKHILVPSGEARDIAGRGDRRVYSREVTRWEHIPGTGGDTNE
jgi:hypothetical protein